VRALKPESRLAIWVDSEKQQVSLNDDGFHKMATNRRGLVKLEACSVVFWHAGNLQRNLNQGPREVIDENDMTQG
jgi:hypothetical protein